MEVSFHHCSSADQESLLYWDVFLWCSAGTDELHLLEKKKLTKTLQPSSKFKQMMKKNKMSNATSCKWESAVRVVWLVECQDVLKCLKLFKLSCWDRGFIMNLFNSKTKLRWTKPREITHIFNYDESRLGYILSQNWVWGMRVVFNSKDWVPASLYGAAVNVCCVLTAKYAFLSRHYGNRNRGRSSSLLSGRAAEKFCFKIESCHGLGWRWHTLFVFFFLVYLVSRFTLKVCLVFVVFTFISLCVPLCIYSKFCLSPSSVQCCLLSFSCSTHVPVFLDSCPSVRPSLSCLGVVNVSFVLGFGALIKTLLLVSPASQSPVFRSAPLIIKPSPVDGTMWPVLHLMTQK